MEEKINSIVIIGKKSIASQQQLLLNSIAEMDIKKKENTDNIKSLIDENIILIINLDVEGAELLEKLVTYNDKKASIIIVGDKNNANLLSIAISAGICAFINAKDEDHELAIAVNKINYKRSSAKNNSTFNVFINAKGGGGASFICSNMAYILSQTQFTKVALIDMDLQFGSLGLNFNINTPKYTIVDAIKEVDELDAVSLSGYMEKYNESLGLLLPSNHEIALPGEVNPKSLEKLISLTRENYNHLIIDLPRMIDPLSMMIMEKADNIVIVLQQNLGQFRDGRRLIHILNTDLEIPLDNITIIINRFDKKHSLKKSDMLKLVNHNKVYTVTNDFNLVATTSNLGIPLYEYSRKSKISKDLKSISDKLGNIQENNKKGWLNKIFS